jgi:hypothetical protein
MAGSGFRLACQVNSDELDRPSTNIPDPGRTRWESTQPFNVGPLRPSKGTHDDERETTDVSAESLQSVDADDFRMWWEQGLAPTAAKGRWRLTAKGRALVGVVAIIGSVLALKGCAPSSDFAYNDPAHTQFPALSGKDNAQSAQGKIAKEQLDDLSTQASLPPLPAGGSGDVPRIPPTAGFSNATAVAPKVDTSAVASLSLQPSSSQSPDLRPARTAPSTSRATVGVRPSSPKLDMPTKRPGKITHRVVAGNADMTAPSAAPDTQSKSLAKLAKPEEANSATGAQAAVQPAVAQAGSSEAAKQPPNSVLQAIGDLFGGRAKPAQQPIDPTPTGSTGWAVQLAASKSEDEANNDLKRLNARYASVLNGSIVRLHKARVSGETVYRLRVVGLAKADAATLCERLKGDGGSCFIVR